MSSHAWPRVGGLFLFLFVLAALPASCLNRADEATPTPTKTPHSAARASSTPVAEARAAFQAALAIDPADADARRGLAGLPSTPP